MGVVTVDNNTGREDSSSALASMPPEILGHIFFVAQSLSKKRFKHEIPFEVIISQVCGQWRAVAIANPRLWTRIEIYTTKATHWVPSYLIRSKALPIDIRLDVFHTDKFMKTSVSRSTIMRILLGPLIPHMHRCRSLFILTYFEETAYDIQRDLFLQGDAMTLERLRVNFDLAADPIDMSTTHSNVYQGSFPRLNFLETEALQCLPSVKSLTTLHLHKVHDGTAMSYENLIWIANDAVSLVSLSIRGTITIWPTHVNRFEMRSLRNLLLADSGHTAVKLLSSIIAPNIESIWLHCSYSIFPIFETIHGGNLFPKLRYLTIQDFDTIHISSFASIFPTITHLHLAYPNFYHITHFTEGMLSDAGAWPNLTALIIHTRQDHFSERLIPALADILPNRTAAGRPIKQLLVDGDLRKVLIAEKSLKGLSKIDEIDNTNYYEPWWTMSQENTPDRL